MLDATRGCGRFAGHSRLLLTVAASIAATTLNYGQSTSTPPQSQPGPPVTVVGRVVEADGKTPIASAVVALNMSGSGPAQADRVLTDSNGRFFFPSVKPDAYMMSVSKPGYLDGAYRQYRPGGRQSSLNLVGSSPGEITLKLWRNAVLTGRIVDDLGEPMVDVAVRAVRLAFIAGHRQVADMTKLRTDDRGVYRFSALTPGAYVIAVVATVTSEPASYEGAVRLQGDLPRAFLQTMTAVGSAPLVEYDAVTGVTGSAGTLATSALGVTSVPPAQGAWLAYPTSYLPAATTLSTARVVQAVSGQSETLPDLQVRLTPTYHVSGELIAPDGPAAYYSVHLVAADAADAPLFDASTAVTDAAGQFTFYGVPPGQYVARVVRTPWPTSGRGLVVASRGNGSDAWIAAQGRGGPMPVPTEPLLAATQAITVGERDVAGMVLNLLPGPRVTGRAEFVGSAPQPTAEAFAAMTVRLEPANGKSFATVFPGRFDDAGTFATPSSWPTRYLMGATAPAGWTLDRAIADGHEMSEVPFDLTSDLKDVVLTFTDHATQITGTIDRADAEAGADVLLFPVEPAAWVDYGSASRRVRFVPCGVTGAFTMPAPPEGEYYLVAIPDEQSADWQNPQVLQKLAGLADRVTVTEGQPLVHPLHLRRLP